jgi:signal transduction histidine kinase
MAPGATEHKAARVVVPLADAIKTNVARSLREAHRWSGGVQEPGSLRAMGMRGGLGKTLLIAFLLLTILPLSLLAFLTYNQIQEDTRAKVLSSLEAMAALKEAHVADWLHAYEHQLGLLAAEVFSTAAEGRVLQVAQSETDMAELVERFEALSATATAVDPALAGLMLVGTDSHRVVARVGGPPIGRMAWSAAEGVGLLLVRGSDEAGAYWPAVTHTQGAWTLVGFLDAGAVQALAVAGDGVGQGVTTQLLMRDTAGLPVVVTQEGIEAIPEATVPEGIRRALSGEIGADAYNNPGEEGALFGAYRWSPDLDVGVVVERSQGEALAAGENTTALVIGATLAVALLSAAIAAVVTRRLTRPIVELTERAAWLARGGLDESAGPAARAHRHGRGAADRRDEVGVLARAFDRMAAELRVLYGSLEAKVAERTAALEAANVALAEANESTRYYAMQLATSAEVARVVVSIRELDVLLDSVVELIRRAFELPSVAIYLLDPLPGSEPQNTGRGMDRREWLEWKVSTPSALEDGDASKPAGEEATGSLTTTGSLATTGRRLSVGEETLVGQAAAEGEPQLTGSELALPLCVRDEIVGVLDLLGAEPDAFKENDLLVFRSLADQISIAIDNARAYAVERETVERLRELDRIQAEFLTNMSHALRTPLNSVIGFSRVMLKELDGPLTDLQRTDLMTIHEGGRQLLGLINDILDLSQLEMGVASFSPGEVDLGEIIEGVMATTHALARSKPIELHADVPAGLPGLYTDGQRVRQVILALLSNAVKFTEEGSIRLEVAADDEHVMISIHEMGQASPLAEWERTFAERHRNGDAASGFGLAVSRRVVEKLGGDIWLEGTDGALTVTLTLPIKPDQASAL